MKTRVALLSLAVLLCLAAPVMAGPIQISDPYGSAYMTGSSNEFGFPGADIFSSLRTEAPGSFGLLGSYGDPLLNRGVGSDHLVQGGGGYLGPPRPNAVPEPSGLMVMLGSGLFGMAGLVGRKLRE